MGGKNMNLQNKIQQNKLISSVITILFVGAAILLFKQNINVVVQKTVGIYHEVLTVAPLKMAKEIGNKEDKQKQEQNGAMGTIEVKVEEANVRTSPSIQSENQAGTVKKGEQFLYYGVEKDARGIEWYKLLDQKTGTAYWISSETTEIKK